LQRALALLLRGDAGELAKVRELLKLPRDASMGEIHDTYRKWWRFYN
jgi:hypothetical protein